MDALQLTQSAQDMPDMNNSIPAFEKIVLEEFYGQATDKVNDAEIRFLTLILKMPSMEDTEAWRKFCP